jgi:hypothetical protein
MFYISSQGHSGTGWLAKSLNKHPEVVCWHGTRSIPPYDPVELRDMNKSFMQLSPKEFIEGLVECEKKTFNNKIFGSIHGFYGIVCKNDVEKNGGKFFAVFRSPILKINSIFNAYIVHLLTNKETPTDKEKIDIIEFFKKYENVINENFKKQNNHQKKITILKKFLKKIRLFEFAKFLKNFLNKFKYNKKLNKYSKNNIKFDLNLYEPGYIGKVSVLTFIEACKRTFDSDKEILENCNSNQIIRMEDFTSSKLKFKNIFFNITNKEIKDDLVDDIFNDQDHINKHSNIKDEEIIFNSWPKTFKNFYKEYIANLELNKQYEKMGYNLPND